MSAAAAGAPAFVHGYPFEAWLADRGRATPADAAALVAALATQVQAARGVGVTPGQAIPGLVRIDATGAPVVDVWSAAQRKTSGDEGHPGRASFGPPPGESPDDRSDVYVLGVVLYHLLVGRFPFTGSNPVELALAHRHEQPLAPSRTAPGVPEVLDELTLRCLAKDPAGRVASLAALADKLTGKLPEALVEPLPPSNPKAAVPAARASAAAPAPVEAGAVTPAVALGLPLRRSWIRGAVASFTIAAAGAGGWWLASPPATTPVAVPAPAPAPSTTTATTIATPLATPVATITATTIPASPSVPVAAPPRELPRTAVAPRRPAPATRPPVVAPSAAPSAGATTTVIEPSAADHRDEITRLLAEGEVLLRQKKYLGGAEPAALDRYREVLTLAPAHAEARAKVELIRGTYLTLARERRQKGDLDAAHRYLAGLDRAFPGDAEIAAELLGVDADRAAASRAGQVAIDVRPWGNVFVDGKFIDQTPMPPLSLVAGAHRIDVEGEQGRRRSVEVTVHGGESQRVSIDLASNDG